MIPGSRLWYVTGTQKLTALYIFTDIKENRCLLLCPSNFPAVVFWGRNQRKERNENFLSSVFLGAESLLQSHLQKQLHASLYWARCPARARAGRTKPFRACWAADDCGLSLPPAAQSRGTNPCIVSGRSRSGGSEERRNRQWTRL